MKIKIHNNEKQKPSYDDAIEAVKTLIKWIGDDPNREGLVDTPSRVIKSYTEFFKGYSEDPREVLDCTFDDIKDYDDMIILNNIRLESYCEHHMVPIIGSASVAYLPDQKIVGISKLARVVDIFSKRLQVQEKLTTDIANAIDKYLKPKGVAVFIAASHQCMCTRGVHKVGSFMYSKHMIGEFKTNPLYRKEFMDIAKSSKILDV